MHTYDIAPRNGLDYASAGTDRNGAAFDMVNFDAVLGVCKFAAVHDSNVGRVFWQQADDSSFTVNAEDLAGTSTVTGNDDNKIIAKLLVRPTRRYVRMVVDKDGTNATGEVVLYLGFSKVGPVTNSGVSGLTYTEHVSPASGTP